MCVDRYTINNNLKLSFRILQFYNYYSTTHTLFFSQYCPRNQGVIRAILDLCVPKGYGAQRSFRMPIKPSDGITSIDLINAFFHVSILLSHRKYLRFAVLRDGLTQWPKCVITASACVTGATILFSHRLIMCKKRLLKKSGNDLFHFQILIHSV